MKSKKSIQSAILLLAATFTQITYSQTVEIDPVTPIPGSHTSIFATEWNTDGNAESWTANAQYTLTPGTPTGGLLTGTQGAIDIDPTLTRSGLNLLSSPDTIIEFKITKDITDTSRIDLFWADDAGGITGIRSIGILQPTFPTDGLAHTVRITFSGQMLGKLTAFRLDPSADVGGQSKATSLDYFRVYSSNPTVLPLTWDPSITAGLTPGGSGDWDTATNRWWDGSSQVAWPVAPAGGNEAIFTGTAGAVALPGAITARYLNFGTTGYSLTGVGPLTLAGPAVFKNSVSTHTTTIDVPIAGGATQTYVTGNYVFTKAGIQTGTTRLYNNATGISVDNPFGASSNKVIFGQGQNVFVTALGAGTERTLANNVDFVANRLIINNNVLGTGLPLLPLNLTGDVLLKLTSPGDLYLRQNLNISGIVSGTGPTAAIFFAGDANTLTLTNVANTFTNNIRFTNSSILQVAADGSMGDAANVVQFNGGTGTLRLLSAFNTARGISLGGGGVGLIDTNGFDSTFSGVLGNATATAAAQLRKVGAGNLTLSTATSNLGLGGLRVNAGSLEIISGSLATGSATSNGVAAGATMRINGGSFSAGNFAVGLGVGTGEVTLDSGTLNNSLEFIVGWTGDGVFNVNGGLANLNNLSLTNAEPFTSTVNLNGGEVRLLFFNARANAVTPATATINFNGSLIQAKGNRTDFIDTTTTTVITANVQAGGAIFDTNNFAITIPQPLVHDPALGATLDGGLTKNGLGTLTLAPVAGPNTYTGPTTVNLGVLAVSGTSIDDTGRLNIGGGKVLIPALTNETVNTLFLNGVAQPAGVYGSTASGAANTNDTFFDVAGSGTLTVNATGTSTGYAAFAAGLSPGGAGDDADFDGLDNAVEYVIGGDPRVSSQAGRPTSTSVGGVITFSFSRVDSSETPDVTTVVEVSTNLVDWTTQPSYTVGADTASSTAGVVVTENGAAADTIVVTIPNTGSASKFARLSVRIAP